MMMMSEIFLGHARNYARSTCECGRKHYTVFAHTVGKELEWRRSFSVLFLQEEKERNLNSRQFLHEFLGMTTTLREEATSCSFSSFCSNKVHRKQRCCDSECFALLCVMYSFRVQLWYSQRAWTVDSREEDAGCHEVRHSIRLKINRTKLLLRRKTSSSSAYIHCSKEGKNCSTTSFMNFTVMRHDDLSCCPPYKLPVVWYHWPWNNHSIDSLDRVSHSSS